MLVFDLLFFLETCALVENNAPKMEQQSPVEHEVKAIQTGKSRFVQIAIFSLSERLNSSFFKNNFCFF